MNGLHRPRDRTIEFALYFPTRHLGPVQMTTDTPLGVTKRVIVDCDSFSLPAIFPQLADLREELIVSLAEIPYVFTLTICVSQGGTGHGLVTPLGDALVCHIP
jgi:hypothetical protein